jgi:ribonucleoside-triphosphate reductase (thioredoxin)
MLYPVATNKLISDIVSFRTYSKFINHIGRRESLAETINRNMNMHLDRFPKLSKDIIKAYQKVHDLKVMPSMRALQFSGEAILKNNARQYNCSFINIDDVRAFGEILFLLLSGVGVGFSVQNRHIKSLPKITKPREEGYFVAHDSISGWAQCVDLLFEAYFFGRIKPQFDFGNIRPKGSYLVTTGAKAPGPTPLKNMLDLVEAKLKLALGRQLTDLEIHDIICIISDSVLAGGIRRAALISLFDRDSNAMLTCKHGEWWNTAPWRARANNSAVLPYKEVTEEEFNYIFDMCQKSGAGEPGFSWTNNLDMGFNPCHEIALNSNQFCNLTTINQTGIHNKKDFLDRVYSAALIGTLQATYTDFPYVRPTWQQTTEREALLGVSFTGIADSNGIVTTEWLDEASKLVLDVNEKYAKKLGINLAARATAIKPEGSSSCVLGSSSGIHSRHAPYYLRRVRMNKDDALAVYLKNVIPDLVEDDKFSASGVVVTIPQQSPENAVTRHEETAESLFKKAIAYNKHWVQGGHRTGDNFHNVSATISVKEDEWEGLRKQMWKNRKDYSGISLLPFNGGSYTQAPFEDCTKEKFEELAALVKNVDLTQVQEGEDNTSRIETLACSGGNCEIT